MQQSIRLLQTRLQDHYPAGEIKAFIRLIFERLCGYDTTALLLRKDTVLPDELHQKIEDIARRLLLDEPIQYILGEEIFCGRWFCTEPGVLIPRPETEELVRMIIGETEVPPRKIADLGTGSGCIAITLALAFPKAETEAWDISPEALRIAARNAERHHAPITFRQQDILRYTPERTERYDLIVSNPPYICDSEREQMSDNVLRYEPASALFVPDNDPLLFYRHIARIARKTLTPGGKLYFEINERFGDECRKMLQQNGFNRCRTLSDCFNKPRFVCAEQPL